MIDHASRIPYRIMKVRGRQLLNSQKKSYIYDISCPDIQFLFQFIIHCSTAIVTKKKKKKNQKSGLHINNTIIQVRKSLPRLMYPLPNIMEVVTKANQLPVYHCMQYDDNYYNRNVRRRGS